LKTGFGPRQSTGLAAVAPPYARTNGIRFSGSRALQHRLSVMRLPGDEMMLEAIIQSVQRSVVTQSGGDVCSNVVNSSHCYSTVNVEVVRECAWAYL